MMQSSDAETVSRPAARNRKQMSRMSSRLRRGRGPLRREELADEVVAWVSLPVADHRVEVGVDGGGGLLQQRHRVFVPAGLAGDRLRADEAVLELEEAGQLVQRQAEQGEEDLGGEA